MIIKSWDFKFGRDFLVTLWGFGVLAMAIVAVLGIVSVISSPDPIWLRILIFATSEMGAVLMGIILTIGPWRFPRKVAV